MWYRFVAEVTINKKEVDQRIFDIDLLRPLLTPDDVRTAETLIGQIVGQWKGVETYHVVIYGWTKYDVFHDDGDTRH